MFDVPGVAVPVCSACCSVVVPSDSLSVDTGDVVFCVPSIVFSVVSPGNAMLSTIFNRGTYQYIHMHM